MTRDRKKYPARLKAIRDALGFSQEDLARELGVSFATVNRWENGRSWPSKLAKAQLNAFCAKMAKNGKLKFASFL